MRAHRQALVAVLATLAAVSVAAGQQAIRWQTNLDAARQWAAQTNRLLLLHFWSETCGPCARMEREVFSRPEVAAAMENNYVPVKINVRQFPMTAQQFGVNSWPTHLILTPQGQVLDRHVGYQTPSAYLARLNQVAAFARNQAAPSQNPPVYGGDQSGRHPFPAEQATGTTTSGGMAGSPNFSAQTDFSHATNSDPSHSSLYTAAETRALRASGPPDPRPGTAQHSPTWQGGTSSPRPEDENAKQDAAARVAAGFPGQGPAPASPSQPASLSNQPFQPSSTPFQQAALPSHAPAWANASGMSLPSANSPSANSVASAQDHLGQTSHFRLDPNSGASDFRTATSPREMGPRDPLGEQLSAERPPYRGNVSPSAGSAASTQRGNPPLALDGYCAVSLAEKERWVRGNPRFGVIHQGRTYLFAGPDEARRFYDDPDRYAPVASGDDVVLLAERGQRVPGRREHGAWYQGRVYLFSDETSYNKFAANPQRYAGVHSSETGRSGGYGTETSSRPAVPGRGSDLRPSTTSASLPASETFTPPSTNARPSDPNALRQEAGWRY